MHHHTSYQKFIKSLNINTSRFESGSIKDVKLFLKANEKLNLNVTIYEGRLCPNSGKLQVWKSVKIGNGEKEVNILHIFQYYMKNRKNYYFYLKNLSCIHNFFQKRYPCLICFNRFTSKRALSSHLQKCSLPQLIYPDKDTFIEFDHKSQAKYKYPLALVGFCDFETKLKGTKHSKGKKSFCKTCKKYYCEHVSFTKNWKSMS